MTGSHAFFPSSPSASAHLLMSSRSRNPRTNNTRQVLLPDAEKQANTPTHRRDHRDRNPRQQPKRHTDILLRARRSSPFDRLDAFAFAPADDRFLAFAGVAGGARARAVVLQIWRAVSGAVACDVRQLFEAGLADGEDAWLGAGGGFEGLGC